METATSRYIPEIVSEPFVDHDRAILVCPVCRIDYVHHKDTAAVIDSLDNYKADRSVRGNVIAIPMYCENHHEFVLKLGFHKGYTYVWADSPHHEP